jgi:hypothetical protein
MSAQPRLGVKVTVKSLLRYWTLHEVHLYKVRIVQFGKFAYSSGLTHLSGTCQQQGFLTTTLIPFLYLWQYFSS